MTGAYFYAPLGSTLMVHKRSMYKYSSVQDPDRHSAKPLALTEIEAQVKAVMALSSGSFMDEDSPHLLSKNILSSLVSSFLFCLLPPPSSFSIGNHRAGFYMGLGPWRLVFGPFLRMPPSRRSGNRRGRWR
jgi:hypothetical protein